DYCHNRVPHSIRRSARWRGGPSHYGIIAASGAAGLSVCARVRPPARRDFPRAAGIGEAPMHEITVHSPRMILTWIMHDMACFCTSVELACAGDPPSWIGVRQLAVQRLCG